MLCKMKILVQFIRFVIFCFIFVIAYRAVNITIEPQVQKKNPSYAAGGVLNWNKQAVFELKIDISVDPYKENYVSIGQLNNLRVKEILNHCAPSSYRDKASGQHLVDDSIRKSFECPGRKLEILSSSNFETAFNPVLLQDLFGNAFGSFDIYLNKLVVYSEGGHFAAHRDSNELDPDNYIGTVVVGLPSAFEGGKLVVRQGGEEIIFNFAEHSADKTKIQFAAFYGDCEHEVLPVTSGHRMVLTYTMVRNRYAHKRVEETTFLPLISKQVSGPYNKEKNVIDVLNDYSSVQLEDGAFGGNLRKK